MKVTFKDVGQGDSIILEWECEGLKKVGIIDCKKKGKFNPVISHIDAAGYDKIEFLILSHPHSDHYSGLLELLSYIEEKKIKVTIFCHTIANIAQEYWEWFEVSNDETKEIAEIIKAASRLKDELYLIDEFIDARDRTRLPLSATQFLDFCSPSHEEVLEYQTIVKRDSKTNKKLASQAANYLSTVIKLTSNTKIALLTSDSENFTFERLRIQNKVTEIYSLCQAAHHGSSNNYHVDFWKNLKTIEDKDVVFSAGPNEQYKHPHLLTVQSFFDHGFKLHATNIVYGMQEFIDKLTEKTTILDSGSDIAEDKYTSGDKIFHL